MLRIMPIVLAALISALPAFAQEATPPATPEAAAETAKDAIAGASAVVDAEAATAVEVVVETVAPDMTVLAAEPAAEDDASMAAPAGPAVDAAAIDAVDAPVVQDEGLQEVFVISREPDEPVPVEVKAVKSAVTMSSDDLNAAALDALQTPVPADEPAAVVEAAAAPVMRKMQVERRVVRNEAGEESTQDVVTLTAPDGTETKLEGVAAKAAIDAAGMSPAGEMKRDVGVRVEVRIENSDTGPGKVSIDAEGATVTQTASPDGKSREIVIAAGEGPTTRITIATE